MSIITEATLDKIRLEVVRRNVQLKKMAESLAKTTWDQIRLDVVAGEAATKYPIGTELICGYTYNGTVYECPWIVMDNDRLCEVEDGSKKNGLWLGMKYGSIEYVQFDNAEGVISTDETAQDGWFYFGKNGNAITKLNVETGDTIPTGSYETIIKNGVDSVFAVQYGYARYSHSALRQWANSDGEAGEWWSPMHDGDNEPYNHNSIKGFLAGLDKDFLDVIRPVKVLTVYDDTLDTTYDRFFPASLIEVYGESPFADRSVEGPFFPYWKTITGLTQPSNNQNNARKLHKIDDLSQTYPMWLRTQCIYGSNQAMYPAHNVADGRLAYDHNAKGMYLKAMLYCVIS